MATFVLVHGAWYGGWCWRKVTPLLRASGHEVYTPTLTGLGERSHLAHPLIGLETHVQDIVNVLSYEELEGVILVGHSNGGTLITAVSHRVPDRLAHLVYLDAFVPDAGQATIDLITYPRQHWEDRVRAEGDGWLIPSLAPVPWEDFCRDVWQMTDESDRRWVVDRLGPTPFKTFTDPIARIDPAAARLSRTYLRCRRHPSPTFDRHTAMSQQATGWRYHALESAHCPMVTAPRELAEILLDIPP